jgi:hypothetical protein
VCPICIALLAAPPFTAPPVVALPPPQSAPVEALALVSERETISSLAAAYRSRAPPSA